jgi:type IV secretion system protein VirB10
MTDQSHLPSAANSDDRGSTIGALDGEQGIPSVAQANRRPLSWKGIFAGALMVFSLVAVTAAAFNRALSGPKKDDSEARRAGERPIAAANEPRKLDMTLAAAGVAPIPATRPPTAVPAIVPTPEDADLPPIGVRRTVPGAQTSPPHVAPEDAPVLLVTSRPPSNVPTTAGAMRSSPPALDVAEAASQDDPLHATRRNLEAYQRQLQTLLDTLNRRTDGAEAPPLPATAAPASVLIPQPIQEPSGLFGGQLQGSVTRPVSAGRISHRSLTLPKGTSFTCALRTRIISAASGMVGCQVQRNVYGEDGRVLLIERGSHVDGEYRITSVRPGTVRIPVLWTRIRTPNGVTVNVESPATGPLGEAGIEGYVDNRWGERIGAAMLLSVIDDAVKLTIQSQASDRQADTVILPSTTSNTSKLAEKVLDSTINIPPLIYQNQGGIVGIYTARDVDFSTVYELKAVPR